MVTSWLRALRRRLFWLIALPDSLSEKLGWQRRNLENPEICAPTTAANATQFAVVAPTTEVNAPTFAVVAPTFAVSGATFAVVAPTFAVSGATFEAKRALVWGNAIFVASFLATLKNSMIFMVVISIITDGKEGRVILAKIAPGDKQSLCVIL